MILFYYIHMMMINLSQTPPNMSSIEAVCDSLGKTSVTSLVGNYWATGGLRVNSSPVKGKFISSPFTRDEFTRSPPVAPRLLTSDVRNDFLRLLQTAPFELIFGRV